jgi:hypothetical protein
MNWLFELHKTQPIAHAVGVLAFVCVLGMALGSVKVKGVASARRACSSRASSSGTSEKRSIITRSIS